MAKTPMKSPIRTKPIPPLGENIELTIWDSPIGNYSIDLEDWQVEAIQQVTGLRAEFNQYDNSADIIGFAREEVEKRVQKMGRLALVIEDEYDESDKGTNTDGEESRPL